MNALQDKQQRAASAKKADPRELKRMMRRMRTLKNEMDFLEILSNFWPLPNMEARVIRLEKEMDSLNRVYMANQHHFKVAQR